MEDIQHLEGASAKGNGVCVSRMVLTEVKVYEACILVSESVGKKGSTAKVARTSRDAKQGPRASLLID